MSGEFLEQSPAHSQLQVSIPLLNTTCVHGAEYKDTVLPSRGPQPRGNLVGLKSHLDFQQSKDPDKEESFESAWLPEEEKVV